MKYDQALEIISDAAKEIKTHDIIKQIGEQNDWNGNWTSKSVY